MGHGSSVGYAEIIDEDDLRKLCPETYNIFESLLKEIGDDVTYSDYAMDVEMDANLHIEIDGFTTFADFFFDGLIFDWIVQSHISKSLAQVENTRQSVSSCLNQLSSLLKINQSRDVAIMKERLTLIERA